MEEVMSRGLGKYESKIIEAFENSYRNQVEVKTLIYYIQGYIDDLDAYQQITKASQKDIKNSLYKSVLRSITTLSKKGYIKKKYKVLNKSDGHYERILNVKYIKDKNK